MPFDAGELLDLVENAKVEVRPKPWGQEVVLVCGDELLIKIITVNAGARTSLQYHREKDELCVMLEGEGGTVVHLGDRHTLDMLDQRPSPPLRIAPGTVHRTYGPTTLLEITTCHDDDVVRVEDDYNR